MNVKTEGEKPSWNATVVQELNDARSEIIQIRDRLCDAIRWPYDESGPPLDEAVNHVLGALHERNGQVLKLTAQLTDLRAKMREIFVVLGAIADIGPGMNGYEATVVAARRVANALAAKVVDAPGPNKFSEHGRDGD